MTPVARPKTDSEVVPTATHRAAAVLLGLSCLIGLIFAADVSMLLVTGKGAERRDFISYWAAGEQLVHHQDPYDPAATLALERTLGYPPAGEALIVRNPPTALLLVAPLGYAGFRTAAALWSLALLASWIASMRLVWIMLDRPQKFFRAFGYPITPIFATTLFAPALACIFYGQTAIFALLGFVLFLRLHPDRPFLAGAALWLCALKPHLFLPFAVVLLLWIAVTRSYRVLSGVIVSLGVSFLAARLLDPLAWQQYTRMMHGVGLQAEFIPCLSIALRFAIHPSATWLQYVAVVAGCIWAATFYLRRRTSWSWLEFGPLLVLVSVLVAPYAWITDQALAAPALLLVAYRCGSRSLLVLALLGVPIEAAIRAGLTMHSLFYLWTAPAWLAWYLFASRSAKASSLDLLNR